MQPLSHPLPLDGRPPAAGRRALAVLIVTLALQVVFAGFSLRREKGSDFFLYYLAARVPLTGHSPYEDGAMDYKQPALRDAVAAHQRRGGILGHAGGKDLFGLRYPPQSYLLFLPFSRLPWDVALPSWAVFMTVAALPCGALAWTFDEKRRPALTAALLYALVLLNPLTQLTLSSGQATLILASAVALGQWLFRRGWYWSGVVAWSFCCIKPHIGLSLVLLTFPTGGWRRFRDVSIAIVALNVLAGLILTGDPLMMLKVLSSGGRKAPETFIFNSVLENHIIGWNRALYVLGGPAIELSASSFFGGFLVWLALLGACVWLRGGRRWSPPFWAAAAATPGLCLGLCHGYDMVVLVLIAPYAFWLWDRRRWTDLTFILGLIALAMVPRSVVDLVVNRVFPGQRIAVIILAYRSFIAVALAAYFVMRGQAGPSLDATTFPEAAPGPTAPAGGPS